MLDAEEAGERTVRHLSPDFFTCRSNIFKPAGRNWGGKDMHSWVIEICMLPINLQSMPKWERLTHNGNFFAMYIVLLCHSSSLLSKHCLHLFLSSLLFIGHGMDGRLSGKSLTCVTNWLVLGIRTSLTHLGVRMWSPVWILVKTTM